MTRQEALAAGKKRYHGAPCKNCAGTERYVCDFTCVECKRTRYREDRVSQIARARNYRLSRRYGITQEEYLELLRQQRGQCKLCERGLDDMYPHVDHCHDSGRVRGILCGQCNRGLGLLGDSPDLLERAVLYLRA
jgi:hypothetical protein